MASELPLLGLRDHAKSSPNLPGTFGRLATIDCSGMREKKGRDGIDTRKCYICDAPNICHAE